MHKSRFLNKTRHTNNVPHGLKAHEVNHDPLANFEQRLEEFGTLYRHPVPHRSATVDREGEGAVDNCIENGDRARRPGPTSHQTTLLKV